jgi:hypothetical protein
MKNANTNKKHGLELTLLKAFLTKYTFEDYLNSFPFKHQELLKQLHSLNSIFETSDYIPSALSVDLHEFIGHSDITVTLNSPNWQYSCGNEPLPPLTIDSINLSKQITMDTEQFLCLKSLYAHRSSHFKFNVDTMSHNIRPFYQISIFGDTFGSVSGGS